MAALVDGAGAGAGVEPAAVGPAEAGAADAEGVGVALPEHAANTIATVAASTPTLGRNIYSSSK